MSRTWLTSCIKVPGPEANLDQYPASYGVPNGGDPYGNQMLGVVNHITAGHFGQYNTPVNVMLGRGNSWPISIFRSGRKEQHFALEAMCWHAGAKANYHYIGIEHECNVWENLTIAQRAATIEVQSEICRLRGWSAIVRGVTGFEHNEFMNTSCPNGCIPWAEIEEGTEDMALTTEDKVWIAAKFKKLAADIQKMHDVTRGLASSSGGGPTPDEIKEAVKDALKEGTD